MGSEQGMGWNWIVHLAKHCELFVITEGEYKRQIEQWMNASEHAVLAKRLHFYYNPVNDKVRKMCWNQGDWRFYKYYKGWQQKAAEIAKDICRHEKIDVLHQLNMIGFREPGYLWKVSREIGIPFVWGPVDAKESFPTAYAVGASLKTRVFLQLKNVITRWQLKHSKRVHKAAETASFVLAASSNSVNSFKKYLSIDSLLMNETGANPTNTDDVKKKNNSKNIFYILWVGKMDFRKQLGIAIKSVAVSNHHDIHLHIVGGGNADNYITEAKSLGIETNCFFHGSVGHNEVLKMMEEADVLLFTSVAEGTPHVVLEAIGNKLPVLCFDTCGQGDCVTEDIGIKIPLTTPEQSVKDFAGKINYLYHHREVLNRMSAKCQKRAEELSWESKAQWMVEKYKEVIS